MIKLIILDVDGIILGHSLGINFPLPSPEVTSAIKNISKSIPISLCTGKTSFATTNLVKYLNLNSWHITDGGAIIYNPITDKYNKAEFLDSKVLSELLDKSKEFNELWQLYTTKSKFVQNNFPRQFEEAGMTSTRVKNFSYIENISEIVKIELICRPEQIEMYTKLFNDYSTQLSVQWTQIPQLAPNKLIIITKKDVNKRSSVDELLKICQIDRNEILTVGDTMMDWKFMDGSKYVATLANASLEMQNIIKDNNGLIGKSVDENGLIDILNWIKEKQYDQKMD